MAGENTEMESFLQNAGDAGAQEEADVAAGEEMAAGETEEAQEKPESAKGEERAPEEITKEADAAGGRPPNYVPIQSLDEERGMRKEAQDQLRESQQTINAMNHRFSEFVSHVKGGEQQSAKPNLPALEDEPVENIDSRLRSLEGMADQYGQQQNVSAQLQQANAQVQVMEQQFAGKTSDYGTAVTHVQQLLIQDLQLRGIDPMAAANQVRQEMAMAAIQVLVAGKDPAEVLYERAKLMGYAPPAGQETQAGTLEAKAAQLKNVEQGQETNRSLSEGGGRAPDRPETLEDLAALDDAGLDKHWDRIIGRAGPTFGGLLR